MHRQMYQHIDMGTYAYNTHTHTHVHSSKYIDIVEIFYKQETWIIDLECFNEFLNLQLEKN